MAAPAPFYPYGTGFGYPQYFAPTVFSGAVAPAEQQVNDAASQSVSVAPDATAAFAGSYFLPSTQLVPVQAPRVRRPGYNERLVAWRNRQKAFNRYKKATKEAIKNANKAPIAPAYPTVFGAPFAAPATYAAPTAFAASTFAAPQVYSYGAPFGATYLPYTFEQQQAPAQAEQYATFQDFSQAGVQEAVEEPEIRGTQV